MSPSYASSVPAGNQPGAEDGPPGETGAQPSASAHSRAFIMVGLFLAFVLAGFVSGFASSSPDGLEKVAEDKGFLASAEDHAFADWPIAGYAVSGIGDERLAGGVAGVIGVMTAFAVGLLLYLAVTWPRRRRPPAPAGSGR